MAVTVDVLPVTATFHMQVTISGLTGRDTVLLKRSDPDGGVRVVRNGDNVAKSTVVDSVVITDYECPLGVPVTYTATGITHDGGGGTTEESGVSAPTQLAAPAGLVLVKSLAQPALSMALRLASAEDVEYPVRQERHDIIGSRFPIIRSDVQGGREGSLTLHTETLTDRTAIKALFQSGETLFFQADSGPAGDGFEDMYFVPGKLVEQRPGKVSKVPDRTWQVPFVEVASPSGVLTALPGNSWLTVTSFGTWDVLLAQRTSWLDVLNRPYGS